MNVHLPRRRRSGGSRPRRALLFLAMFAGLIGPGCGYIADDDQKIIAKWDNEIFRRADMKRELRKMTDEDRPLIQTRGDLSRAVNAHVDGKVKKAAVKQLRAENKLEPRREPAREAYFKKCPEYRTVYEIQDPAAVEMTQPELNALKEAIELGIDDEEEKLMLDDAVLVMAREAFQAGTLTLSDDEFAQEYRLREAELVQFESIEFLALRFLTDMPNAVATAAEARRRIEAGESFDQIAGPYAEKDPSMVLRSGFENNPDVPKFREFWDMATGANKGDIIGPIYLPPHELAKVDASGKMVAAKMPGAHLVFEVLEHTPARTKTMEEARPVLAQDLFVRKMMARLREQHGVEILEENLWNPEGFGDQFKGTMIKTTVDPLPK